MRTGNTHLRGVGIGVHVGVALTACTRATGRSWGSLGQWSSTTLLPGTDFHAWTSESGRARIRLSGKPFTSQEDLLLDRAWWYGV
jgi:hypothetical protein